MKWDDLKVFAAVAEAQSMREAGKKMGISHSTVARRIEALEQALKVRLFERRPDGIRLSKSGNELISVAREMDMKLHDFERKVLGRDSALKGDLIFTFPHTYVLPGLTPVLTAFMQEHQAIRLKVIVSSNYSDLSRREADVALRFTKNPPDHLIGRRLGVMHQAVYGRRDYVEKYKPHLKSSKAGWIAWGEPFEFPWWINESPYPHLPVLGHFDDIVLQVEAVKMGAGLGYFPCILADNDTKLVRLSPPIPDRDLWILYHRDMKDSPRVVALKTAVINYVNDIKPALEGHGR